MNKESACAAELELEPPARRALPWSSLFEQLFDRTRGHADPLQLEWAVWEWAHSHFCGVSLRLGRAPEGLIGRPPVRARVLAELEPSGERLALVALPGGHSVAPEHVRAALLLEPSAARAVWIEQGRQARLRGLSTPAQARELALGFAGLHPLASGYTLDALGLDAAPLRDLGSRAERAALGMR